MTRRVTIDELTTPGDLAAAGGLWREILDSEPFGSPFLSHEWFHSCVESYGEGKRLLGLVVRQGSEPIGIAPLWIGKARLRGLPVTRLEPISCPDTPFVDFVLRPERRTEALRAILDHLYRARCDLWDVLNLKGLPVDSPSYAAMRHVLAEERYPAYRAPSTWSPYIAVRGPWDEFFKGRSVKFRKTSRNVLNRIGRLDDVRLDCYTADPHGEVLERLLAVSRRSWKHDRGIAISSTRQSRSFFEALTRTGGRRGWLMIWVLSTGDRPIAMEYDLVDGGTVYGLRADFDERFGDYSPGKYLELEIVRRLFEQGFREYSTGPGLNAYKLHWTSVAREGAQWNLCNANLRGMLGWIVEGRVAPALRRMIRGETTTTAAARRGSSTSPG